MELLYFAYQLKLPLYIAIKNHFKGLYNRHGITVNFLLRQVTIYGATGTLCYGFWIALPMGFKARHGTPLSALFSHLCVMILRVNSDQVRAHSSYLSLAKQECYR